MKQKIITAIIAVGILALASFFRLYGFNWDQNQHLHPDERFLTMVAGAISWPQNLYDYLDTETSPLNPHNRGFGFFVYGTFPIFFTKWVAEYFKKGDYINLTLVGRQLSALFDIGTVMLVFLITRKLVCSMQYAVYRKAPLVAMFFYASMVLPIQLSHFFAVDTYLTFFITLSFYLLIKVIGQKNILNTKYLILNTLLGISFGLALASKISAILFLPIILIALTVYSIRYRMFMRVLILGLVFIISAYFTFRLAQPYLFASPNILDFTLNEKVLDNWRQLKSFDDPSGGFPPAVQWIKTKPYLFPLKNLVLWGLGLPLGIISVLAVFYSIVKLLSCYIVILRRKINKQFNHSNNLTIEKAFNNNELIILTLITLWAVLLFFYQGFQFVKALRYFYPIYPFLAIISSSFLYQIANSKYKKISNFLYVFLIFNFLFLILLYPFSFLTIYSRPHTRVAASEWIYKNIPPSSYLSGEHWDDFLPLSVPTSKMTHEKYKNIEFPLYDMDTPEKWGLMEEKLKQVDYIILTSNRLYGSLTTVPEKFPATYNYYKRLFDGSLGFEKVAEFTSRPNIPVPFINLCLTPPFARYGIIAKDTQGCPLPGISFVDDYADETFTVYDHPKVLIFKKTLL